MRPHDNHIVNDFASLESGMRKLVLNSPGAVVPSKELLLQRCVDSDCAACLGILEEDILTT